MVNVRGIDNPQITNIPIVTAGGVIKTQHGPAIAILHQYAYTGQGKTIHSSGQLEWYKNDVNDKSIKVAGGLQCILTNDGYVIPIDIFIERYSSLFGDRVKLSTLIIWWEIPLTRNFSP